jgi:hypothetical protein
MQGHTSTFVLWVIAVTAMAAFGRTLTRLFVYLSAISVGCLRFRLHGFWLFLIWCVVAIASVYGLVVVHHAFSDVGGSSESWSSIEFLGERLGAIVLVLAGPLGSGLFLMAIRGDARRVRVLETPRLPGVTEA